MYVLCSSYKWNILYLPLWNVMRSCDSVSQVWVFLEGFHKLILCLSEKHPFDVFSNFGMLFLPDSVLDAAICGGLFIIMYNCIGSAHLGPCTNILKGFLCTLDIQEQNVNIFWNQYFSSVLSKTSPVSKSPLNATRVLMA